MVSLGFRDSRRRVLRVYGFRVKRLRALGP